MITLSEKERKESKMEKNKIKLNKKYPQHVWNK